MVGLEKKGRQNLISLGRLAVKVPNSSTNVGSSPKAITSIPSLSASSWFSLVSPLSSSLLFMHHFHGEMPPKNENRYRVMRWYTSLVFFHHPQYDHWSSWSMINRYSVTKLPSSLSFSLIICIIKCEPGADRQKKNKERSCESAHWALASLNHHDQCDQRDDYRQRIVMTSRSVQWSW